MFKQVLLKMYRGGTFLVVQWLRIHLPMQGTWVRLLVLELRSHVLQGNYVHEPQLLETEKSKALALQDETPLQ